MSAASFQDLCDGFCRAAAVEPPVLNEDSEGVMSFSTDIEDVTVNIMHIRSSHPESAFVLVDFGSPADEDKATVLQTLLLVNFTLLGDSTAMAFSIHPVFGTVTLQANYPFRQHDGAHLLKSVRMLVSSAIQWREGHFLSGTRSLPSAAADIASCLRA
ncbi:MAG: CesT family type III secretion system chaperone [Pseudomonadota bacterium]